MSSACENCEPFEYQLEPTHTPIWVLSWLDAVEDWHQRRDPNDYGCKINAGRSFERGWYITILIQTGQLGPYPRTSVIYPLERGRKDGDEPAELEYAYLERVAQQCSSALIKLRKKRGPAIRYTDEQIARWVKEANERVRKANEVRHDEDE